MRGRSTCAGPKEKSKAGVLDAFGRGGEEDGDGGLSGRWHRDFLFCWFCHAVFVFGNEGRRSEGSCRLEMRKKNKRQRQPLLFLCPSNLDFSSHITNCHSPFSSFSSSSPPSIQPRCRNHAATECNRNPQNSKRRNPRKDHHRCDSQDFHRNTTRLPAGRLHRHADLR